MCTISIRMAAFDGHAGRDGAEGLTGKDNMAEEIGVMGAESVAVYSNEIKMPIKSLAKSAGKNHDGDAPNGPNVESNPTKTRARCFEDDSDDDIIFSASFNFPVKLGSVPDAARPGSSHERPEGRQRAEGNNHNGDAPDAARPRARPGEWEGGEGCNPRRSSAGG